MIIQKTDAEKMVGLFFDLIDAHYGSAVHHIGDSDSIDEETANKMREMYNEYASSYFMLDNKYSVFIVE